MPGQRRPGMDHELYPYLPMPERPPLAWPGQARLAWSVIVHLDWWELLPADGSVRAPGVHGPWGNFNPDWRTFTYREFGHRIGIFRILDALRQAGVRCTFALGAEVARRYPEVVAACMEHGGEFAAHGTHATRIISSKMSVAEERAFITESIDAVARATGSKPTGWVGQDFGESLNTADLLRQSGISWFCDWPNDDQPYRFNNGLLALPYQAEWDDLQLLWLKQVPSWDYPTIVEDAANRLAVEGGRMLTLHVRPWLFGQPGRIRYLEEALKKLSARADGWNATARDIARHFVESGR